MDPDLGTGNWEHHRPPLLQDSIFREYKLKGEWQLWARIIPLWTGMWRISWMIKLRRELVWRFSCTLTHCCYRLCYIARTVCTSLSCHHTHIWLCLSQHSDHMLHMSFISFTHDLIIWNSSSITFPSSLCNLITYWITYVLSRLIAHFVITHQYFIRAFRVFFAHAWNLRGLTIVYQSTNHGPTIWNLAVLILLSPNVKTRLLFKYDLWSLHNICKV